MTSLFGPATHRCPRCKTDVIIPAGYEPPACSNCGGVLFSVTIDPELVVQLAAGKATPDMAAIRQRLRDELTRRVHLDGLPSNFGEGEI